MKIRPMLVAAVLAVSALGSSTPPASLAAGGFCFSPTQGSRQAYVYKTIQNVDDGSTVFDLVRGDAYATDLNLCIGNTAGTFILPANVQGSGGHIIQLGMGKASAFANGALRFFWTNDLGEPQLITSVVPVVGYRYRFVISRESAHPRFRIYQLTGGTTLIYDHLRTAPDWDASFDTAWWGYEAFDYEDSMGVKYQGQRPQMAYMGYSGNANGTIYYRSGLTGVAKSANWGDPDRACAIGDWVYGDDMLSCWDTTYN